MSQSPFSGLSAEDLVTLNEEIAGMARAGLPLDQGLSALARDMGMGRLQRVTAGIAGNLSSGMTLPEAIAHQGDRVPPYYAGLVLAGVRTGRLHEVLATLTVYARTLADMRSIVLGALFYPAVVMVLAFIIFGFVFFFIMPQFEQIFHDFKLRLPAVTEVVFWIARRPLQIIVAPVLTLIAGVVLLRLVLGATARGKRAWARLVYSLPIVGTLVRSARLAAFADLLGILVDHEVPLPEALQLASLASSDPILTDAAQRVQDDLKQGRALAETARARAMVPDLVAWMIGLGEKQGTLGQALHHVAQMFRRQVDMRAALLRNVLPPFLIIVTAGVIVTVFVLAIGLPMLSLLEGLSGNKR